MLTFPQRKQIRSKVIADYVQCAGYSGVVVFTCGNSANALRNEGVDVLEVGGNGWLVPGKWWKPEEIKRTWPQLFDATSGHLPLPLMLRVAQAFCAFLGNLGDIKYDVPTGSGETIICLRWAYPGVMFNPIYNLGEPTRYEQLAPLNWLVAATRAAP